MPAASPTIKPVVPTPLAYSAFISHSSADAEKAAIVVESLEAKGFRCWVAPRDIRAGHEYGLEIIHGIENSRCVVLLLSQAANESPFVRMEVERGVSKRKPVFPVRVEEVMPSPSLELFVSSAHWIDAWTGPLVEHVDLLARDLGDASIVQRATAASAKIARRRQLPKWIALALLFVAIIGAMVIASVVSARINRSNDEPHKGLASTGSGAPSDAQQGADWWSALIKKEGVDPAKLKNDSFTVSLSANRTRPNRYLVDIHPTVDGVGNVMMFFRSTLEFDGGKPKTIMGLRGEIDDAEGTVAGASKVKLTLRSAPGIGSDVTIGPFEYPVTIDASAQAVEGTSGAHRGGLKISASKVPLGKGPAPVLVESFPSPAGELRFDPACPTSTVAVRYSFDDGGDFEVKRGRARSQNRDAMTEFAFSAWTDSRVLKLTLVDGNGAERGPFEYTLPARETFIVNEAKAMLMADLGNAIDAIAVPLKIPSSELIADPTKLNGTDKEARKIEIDRRTAALQKRGSAERSVTSAHVSFVTSAPAIACRMKLYADAYPWLSVKEVRVGVQADHLETVAPTTFDLDAFWRQGEVSFWNGASRGGGNLHHAEPTAGAFWNATLPLGSDSIYAHFVFRDGSTSKVMRYRVDTQSVPPVPDDH